MERYIVDISFKTKRFEECSNIVERVKTMKEALTYSELIDETVDSANIKDTITGKVTWLKN